jgi:predicted protein tyrosine phosphatase
MVRAMNSFETSDMTKLKTAAPSLRTTRLHVCSLATVQETIGTAGASHLITVINAQTMLETPAGIEARRHLKIAVNDIAVPQPGLVHPRADHVGEIIRFARDWNHAGPLVVHCWAGISRSTAAAFIALCTLNDEGVEAEIARSIRAASSTATPNPLMVELADEALGRRGRMVDAVAAIGQGEVAISGTPFSIPSRFSATR